MLPDHLEGNPNLVINQEDSSQTLDLYNWLDDLSKIKDAFGVEATSVSVTICSCLHLVESFLISGCLRTCLTISGLKASKICLGLCCTIRRH